MDLGYHFDLMELVLMHRNYSRDAIRISQFNNGLTDLVGNFLSAFPSGENDDQDSWLTNAKRSVRLHADNLFSAGDAKNYLHQLLANLQSEAKEIEGEFNAATTDEKKNTVSQKLAVLIGMGFHACQDFCSHSTWVSQLPPSKRQKEKRIVSYLKETPLRSEGNRLNDTTTGWYEYLKQWDGWKSVKDSLGPNTKFHSALSAKTERQLFEVLGADAPFLQSLQHKNKAIHLDAQSRFYEQPTGDANLNRLCTWDEAYVCAFLVCEDVITYLETAAPETANHLKSEGAHLGLVLSPSQAQALASAMHLMRYLFMWLQDGDHHDGHWKGPGSGDIAAIAGNLGIAASVVATLLFVSGAKATLLALVLRNYLLQFSNKLNGLKGMTEEFSNLLDVKNLTKDLYNTQADPPSAPENLTTEPTNAKVLSIHIDSCVMFRNVSFSANRFTDHPSKLLPLDADLFVRATVRWKDKTGRERSITYDDRVHQNIGAKLDSEVNPLTRNRLQFELKKTDDHTSPWEILHIARDGDTEVRVYLQLLDEDTLATGADDEIKISNANSLRYGIEFAVDLQNSTLTHVSGLDLPTTPQQVANNETAVVFNTTGGSKQTLFAPQTANLSFSLVIADIK